MECHNPASRQLIEKVIEWFKKSSDNNQIYESYNDKENKDVYMVALRDENKKLIGYYENTNIVTAKKPLFIMEYKNLQGKKGTKAIIK